MMNIWDLNKKLNSGQIVHPILGSGTQSRNRSHLQNDDSSQTPSPKPIINEMSNLGW